MKLAAKRRLAASDLPVCTRCPRGRDLFVLGLAEDGRPLDLEDISVGAVHDGVVLHREPPAEGVHPPRLHFARLGEQVEHAGNAGDARKLADADHLEAVIGLENDLGHAGIIGNAVDFDVLQPQLLLQLIGPVADGGRFQCARGRSILRRTA